jgi:predicted acyl esterase
MNQLLAATLAGPELKAIAPAMIGWDLREELVEEGGVPQLAGAIGWAAQVGADTARHQGDEAAWLDLRAAAQNPPCNSPCPRPEPLVRHARYNHLLRWSEAEADDPCGRPLPRWRMPKRWRPEPCPCCSSAAGTISRSPVRSPDGGPWSDRAGLARSWSLAAYPVGASCRRTDYGPDAVSDVDRHQVAWFDHWLKGKPLDRPRVRLFDMGTRVAFGRQAGRQRPNAVPFRDRRGRYRCRNRQAARSPGATGNEVIVHDPWRPAPSVGGRMGNPPGPVDRRAIDERGDIATSRQPR